MTDDQSDRLHYMDSLRAVAMFLGLVLHASVLYKIWVYDPLRVHEQPSLSLHYIAEAIHVFRMELFFLVAGFFSALVCQKRGAASYAKNRVARILLPLTLCVIFIHPWIAGEMWIDLQAGNQSVISTYLEFISSPNYILTKGRPVGGWLWHFWFLHVLCYLIGIYLALDLALRNSQRLGRARQWLTKRLHRPLGILYLITPTFAVLTFSPPWADVPGIGTSLDVLGYYSIFFFAGVIINSERSLLDSLSKNFKYFCIPFFISFVLMVPLIDRITLTSSPDLLLQDWSLFEGNEAKAGLIGTYPVVQNPFNFSTFSADADWFVMCGLRAFCTWSAISGFILLFKTFFDRQSALGRYASDSSYFIYLIHFPIQICIGRHLRDHVDSAFACFLINLFVSLILCVALYHYLCRNTWIGVMLSGRRYPRNVDRELIELRSLLSHRITKWVIGSTALVAAIITTVEHQPEIRILKMSYYAKATSVQQYIEENPNQDLTEITRSDGRNPLHMAAHGMRSPATTEAITSTINALLQAGIPIDSQDHFGQCPLHYSVRTGNVDALNLLLQNGANPNIKDNIRGNTPLHLAATLGAEGMIEPLILAGGRVNEPRNDGLSPNQIMSKYHGRELSDTKP